MADIPPEKIVNPGSAEDSPFRVPEIVLVMAEQRGQRIAEHRAHRDREAKIRSLLSEKHPEGWAEEEDALDAEQKRLAKIVKGMKR